LTAALAATNIVGDRGVIILATDAGPREDEATFEELKKRLVDKKITCHTIWKDQCVLSQNNGEEYTGGSAAAYLTAEEVYPELAEISDGLSLPFDEMEEALDLILEALTAFLLVQDQSAQNVLILCGGYDASPGPQLIPVPIDSGVASVEFVVTHGSETNVLLEVLRPNGSVVLPTDSDATIFAGAGLKVIAVTAPAAGIWSMRITANGPFYAYVRGIDGTAIFDVSFLRVEETEDGPVVSIIEGPLQLWEEVMVQVDMIGPLPALSFDLIRPDGTVIEPLELTADALGLGTYSVPAK
jgi:hypothetical protein